MSPDESLLKITNFKIERAVGAVNFSVYELLSPSSEFKFYALPTQVLPVEKPKPTYIIKGHSEIEVITALLFAVRGVPHKELFEPK